MYHKTMNIIRTDNEESTEFDDTRMRAHEARKEIRFLILTYWTYGFVKKMFMS